MNVTAVTVSVTVREFCLRPGKYLASLPFNLVRYDKIVAVVSEPWEPEIEPKKNIEKEKKISTKISEKKKEIFEELKKDPEIKLTVPTVHKIIDELPKEPPKTFWFNGKKYLVDEFGNEKEVK